MQGDSVKLQQILINLLGNAVRFTNLGEVALRCAAEETGGYRFDVIDTGPGIPAEERERIFLPFHQVPSAAAAGGSGLGLAIARRQAELMGGSLSLAPDRGVGSVFQCRVALAAAAGSMPPAASSGSAQWRLAASQSLTVLVVDDVAVNRDVLARLLRDAGCSVREAGSGTDALASLAAHAVDVLFLDMRMPGSDGLAVLRELQQRPARPPVIAYSAAAFEQDRERFLAAGCEGVVSKPIAVDALFETLAAVCGTRFERSALPDDDERALREPDYARLQVPAVLLQRMLAAAELHSATVLKACLEELRGLGPEEQLLARHLRRQLRAYDMTAVARLLLPVSHDTRHEPLNEARA